MAPLVPTIFERIPPQLRHDTVMLFYVASGLAFLRLLQMPLIGFLEGLQSYTAANGGRMLANILRFVLTIVFMETLRPSVAWVGWAALISMAAETVFLVVACYRCWPGLQISPRLFSKAHLRQIWGFGINAFILTICSLLIFSAPTFIIAKMIGFAAVTAFSVGFQIMNMLREVISSIGSVLVSVFSASHALDNKAEIESRLWRGSQVCNLLTWIVIAGVLTYNGPLVLQWTRNEDLTNAAYWSVVILLLSQLPTGADYVANAALAGCGYLKWLVITHIGVAVTTITGGVVLISYFGWGVEGMAWAMAVPMVIRNGIWLPWYTCRKLGVPLAPYLAKAVLRPAVACALIAGLCLVVQRIYPVHDRLGLFVTAVGMGVVSLVVGAAVGLSPSIRERLMAPVIIRLRTLMNR
jgi:O-antigen/teichoic acid export membrane protein